MAIAPASRARIAILAKAPVAGYAKTRLIPALGADGAARLQAALAERAIRTALAADLGPVTLWCAPDTRHPWFETAARRWPVALAAQDEGDLGARMLAAFAGEPPAVLVVGTDCPCLAPPDLHEAGAALARGTDLVMAPAEDGGYGLIGAERPIPELFANMPWGTERVAAETRARARSLGLGLVETRTVWDVDTPDDLKRLRRSGLLPADDVAASQQL